jgi:hypothetical protein
MQVSAYPVIMKPVDSFWGGFALGLLVAAAVLACAVGRWQYQNIRVAVGNGDHSAEGPLLLKVDRWTGRAWVLEFGRKRWAWVELKNTR